MGWTVRRLGADDLRMIAMIDRSEHVDVEYAVVDGALTERPVTMVEIPTWQPTGSGPHTVTGHIEFCRPLLAGGAVLLGVLDEMQPAGLAVVDPAFEPGLAWLAWLHVTRPYRRRGVGRALWASATDAARLGDARSMYVSATPTGSAVGFYLSQGCRLADPPHPALLASEPDDIHLVCPLA
jgi:GNAT superfamily N-acetyltransferase